jgi:ribosomal protein L34E
MFSHQCQECQQNIKGIPQGLNRLRKKAGFSDKSSENIPPGLKPALILAHLRHD